MRLEAAVPEVALQAIRAPFAAAGGVAVASPVAEPLGLYLDLAGEALRERLFLVQGPGREEYCLRPDFTLGIALAHIAGGAAGGRYVYEGPAFRVAPHGSGRSEQFLQIGLEAFEEGEAAPADAAMAALAWRSAAAGGRDDLELVLGDVALFGAFVAHLGVAGATAARLVTAFSHPGRLARELAAGPPAEQARLAELLAGLDESSAVGVLEEIWSVAGIEPVGGRGAAEIVRRLAARAAAGAAPRLEAAEREAISRYLGIAGAAEAALAAIGDLAGRPAPALAAALAGWERRLAALSEIPPGRMRLAAGFARSLAYYDGVFFEVRSAALGEDRAVAAGGRYDSLPARLGAPLATGAVGCMVRPRRAWREGEA